MKADKRAAIAARLARITEECGGVLDLDSVIADARNPDSPLHDEYNWNVEEAAMAHWRERTRAIIRSVQITVEIEERVLLTPCYVHDPEKKNGEDGYIPLASIRREGSLARDVLAAELSRAVAAMERTRVVAAALGLSDEVSEVIDRLESMRQRFKNAA